jgi:hypothetical protein
VDRLVLGGLGPAEVARMMTVELGGEPDQRPATDDPSVFGVLTGLTSAQ